ncbi:DUF4345 domain-containing protein [Haliscomenobacter sp.]|uniref:DUF4345 domain-containing protein n=1 Tax=Haliscomenobacter sp. TaxID=2717303 RepID=UPI00359461E4
MSNQIITHRNLHLGITSITIGLVGLTYGICPSKVLPLLFTFKVESVDLNHVFRATMGLYVGFATYWMIGIFKFEHWRNATLSSVIFMGGLAFGRMISIIIDGAPSIAFSLGAVAEIVLMLWGINNLKIASKTK